MHGQQGDAFAFRAPCELRRVDRVVIPAQPHFQGNRNIHRADDGTDEVRCEIEIAHQGGTGRAAGDALGGTSHIDVDHGGTGGFRKPRRFSQWTGCVAGNLHDMRRNPLPGSADHSFAIPADVKFRVQHFRNGQRCAKAHGKPAHAEISNASHGRKKGTPFYATAIQWSRLP